MTTKLSLEEATAIVRDGVDLLEDVVDYVDDMLIGSGVLRIYTNNGEILRVKVVVENSD